MSNNKTIKELSVVELKAAKCDCIENIEQNTMIIKAINQELQSRQEQPLEKDVDVEVEAVTEEKKK